MGGQTNISISASTFQNLPKDFSQGALGENFSTIGANINHGKIPHWSVYAGVGITVPDKTDIENIDKPTSYNFIGDIKSSHTYYEGEYFSLSVDSRTRTKANLFNGKTTTDIRVAPVSINIPLNDKSSVYAVPYALTKIDYGNLSLQSLGDNFKTGLYFGGKRKFHLGKHPVTVFAEGQFYDLEKTISDATNNKPMDWSTFSINAGVTVPIDF